MEKIPSHLEIAAAAVGVFADDNTLDVEELSYLIGLAMRDGFIDADEQRILESVFSQLTEKDVSPRVWARIGQIRDNYALLSKKPEGPSQ